MLIPNPRKWASIVSHDRLGVRLAPSHAGAIFMRDWCTNPKKNNRGKQGRSVYTSAKRLLGCLLNMKILQVFAVTKKWKIVSCVPRNTACHY